MSAALWEAQGTLWDCRSSLILCREGGLGRFGAIAKSPTDLYSDVAGEGGWIMRASVLGRTV